MILKQRSWSLIKYKTNRRSSFTKHSSKPSILWHWIWFENPKYILVQGFSPRLNLARKIILVNASSSLIFAKLRSSWVTNFVFFVQMLQKLETNLVWFTPTTILLSLYSFYLTVTWWCVLGLFKFFIKKIYYFTDFNTQWPDDHWQSTFKTCNISKKLCFYLNAHPGDIGFRA